jgi:carbohydrate kinase (thermoresistant glucokinase family)
VIVLVMGVAGAGKSTVGADLARRLGWRFIDADDHHPPRNVAKMAAGIPLGDEDRWPWLDQLNKILLNEKNIVLACSALKESYRRRLLEGVGSSRIVHLHGNYELIAARLASRRHRYMPASLLESQFVALEPPAGAIAIDVAAEPARCVDAIVAELQLPM